MRLGYKNEDNFGMTKGQIEHRRKNEIIANLTAKYGNVTVGIHG